MPESFTTDWAVCTVGAESLDPDFSELPSRSGTGPERFWGELLLRRSAKSVAELSRSESSGDVKLFGST